MYFLLDACKHPTFLRVLYFGYLFWEILAVLVPIGLIIMLMIDFTKAVVISKEDEQIKSMKLVGKRIMYAVFIFATPWMVSFVMSTLGSAGIKTGDDYTLCINTVKNIANGTDNIEKYDKLLEEEEKIEKQKLEEQRKAAQETQKELAGEIKYVNAANQMLNIAKAEIGHKGGGKYSGYSDSTPWCAFFVVWLTEQTKIDGEGTLRQLIEKEGRIYSTGAAGGTMVNFNTASNLEFHYSKFYGGNYTPKKGDIIYYRFDEHDWDKNIQGSMISETSHVGVVDYVEGNKIHTIEGNVSMGNGGGSANNEVASLGKYTLDSPDVMGYGSWYKLGVNGTHQSSSGEIHGDGKY